METGILNKLRHCELELSWTSTGQRPMKPDMLTVLHATKKTMDLYLKNDLRQNWTCSVVHILNMSLLLRPWETIGGSQTNGTEMEARQGGECEARAQSRWPSRPDAAENPAKQIMSRLDYLGDPDYSGASSSGSAPGCLCRDQLFSLSFLPGLSCLSPAPDQPERRRRHAAHAVRRVMASLSNQAVFGSN